MADTQIRGLGTGSAPLSYTVPGAQEIILKSLFATFDGSAAAASFLPCIRVIAPGGGVVAEYITDSAVAAGSSAEVTFAPFLRGAAASAGALAIDHNAALVGSESVLDFTDSASVVWTVTDVPGTSVTVSGTASGGAGGLPNCVRTDQTGQTVAIATEALVHWHDANDFGTTDAGIFAEDSFAAHTIYLSATGLYLAWFHIDFGSFQDPLLVGAGIRWADHGALWPQISPQRLIDTDSGINGQYNAGNTPPSSYYLDVISYAYLSDATAPGAQLQVFFNNQDPVNAADLAAYVLTVWQIQPITGATLAGFPSFHF